MLSILLIEMPAMRSKSLLLLYRLLASRGSFWKSCSSQTQQRAIAAFPAQQSCLLCHKRISRPGKLDLKAARSLQCRAASAAPEATSSSAKPKGGKQQQKGQQKGGKTDELRVTPRSEDFSRWSMSRLHDQKSKIMEPRGRIC